MKIEFQYLTFLERPQTGKTHIYACVNNHSGEELGIVKWYGPWRQYCYFPTVRAVYSAGCMNDIASFILQLKNG